MPTHAGPNTLGEEHLVFSYDLSDQRNSYLGEPTTNLANTTPLYGGWPGSYTLIDGTTKTFDFTTSSVEWGGVAAWTTYYYNVSEYTGQYVTISAVVESFDETRGVFSFMWIGQTVDEEVYLGYSPEQDRNVKTTKTRERISWSGVIGTGGKVGITIWMNNGNGGTSGGIKVRFSNLQVEVKSHPTPFVNGTRSVTQGLLPLISNTSINLSSVSFDSNAQMVFDGTDDTISVSSNSAMELVDNVSIEYVYMRLSTDSILDVIANKYHNTGWELFCTTANTFALAGRNGDGTYYSTSNAAYTIQNNTYYHLVAIKEGLSWRLYVNGELYASLTANSIGTWSNTGILQIGGEGAGYFPNMKLPVLKIYNRVLTASEISRNFNAIKSRFNI